MKSLKTNLLALSLLSAPILTFALDEAPVVDRSNTYVNVTENKFNDESFYQAPAKAKSESEQATKVASKSENDINAELINKLETLSQELSALRGQVEIQSHDLKMLKEEQLAFYKDVDGRLLQLAPGNKEVEKKAVAVEEESTSDNNNLVNQAKSQQSGQAKPDEQLSYAFAYEQIEAKRYISALQAMNDYISHFPNGAYTPNAYYWKGELLLKDAQYESAANAFLAVVNKFPDSTKVAPAMYKLGTTYAYLGEIEKAQSTLNEVISQFPDTATARLAKSKLSNLEKSIS